jgi:protein-tyrosine phosphatase
VSKRKNKKPRVLFVCMGNICRSPTAEGMFRKILADAGLSEAIDVDSAGTHAYHIGEQPDRRTLTAAAKRGIDISWRRGRQVARRDFDEFDLVLAMDRENHRDLIAIAGPKADGKLHLFLDFAPEAKQREVPDPYFGGADGFEAVLDLVEAGGHGLLRELKKRGLLD